MMTISSIKRIAFFGVIISLAAVLTSGSFVTAEADFLDIRIKGTANRDFANKILAQVNIERKNADLLPLTMSDELIESADTRARECILRYSHSRTVPSAWTALISSGYRHAGENLAIGYSSAEAAVAAWMASESHKANILGPDYKTIGVGVFEYSNPDTGKTVYTCAQHFSNVSSEESKKSGKKDSVYSVSVDMDYYPLKIDLYINEDKNPKALEIGLNDEAKVVIKIKGDEMFDYNQITAETETLKWTAANPDVAYVTTGGSIRANGIGRTTMEAVAVDGGYKAVLDINVIRPIHSAEVGIVSPRLYSGSEIKPEVSILDGEEALIKGEDYEVTYSDNIYPGTGKIHIRGIGEYGGERILYFSVYDESTVIKEGFIKRFLSLFNY